MCWAYTNFVTFLIFAVLATAFRNPLVLFQVPCVKYVCTAHTTVIWLIQRLSYFPGHITRQTQVTRHLTVPTLLRRHLQAGVWGQHPVTRRLSQRGWRWRWRACSHNSEDVFIDSLFCRPISSDAAKQRTRQYLKACVAIFLVMSINITYLNICVL